MPWENIGECGDGQLPEDREWLSHCYSMAVSYLKFVIDDIPEGCRIGVKWSEHDLDDYPSVSLFWDFPQTEPPWKFIKKCEGILQRFDDSINWIAISPDAIAEDFEEEENEEEWDEWGEDS